jgi:hypothetical protein
MAQILADIQTISIVVTMASVMVGIVVGVFQLRNLVKTRQIRLYLQLYNKLTEKDTPKMLIEVMGLWTWKNVDDFFDKYGPETHLDEFAKFVVVTTHLENIGLLLKEKLVNVRWVAYLIGTTIEGFWERYQPILIELQKRWNAPKVMPMTEYLYETLKQVRPR